MLAAVPMSEFRDVAGTRGDARSIRGCVQKGCFGLISIDFRDFKTVAFRANYARGLEDLLISTSYGFDSRWSLPLGSRSCQELRGELNPACSSPVPASEFVESQSHPIDECDPDNHGEKEVAGSTIWRHEKQD